MRLWVFMLMWQCLILTKSTDWAITSIRKTRMARSENPGPLSKTIRSISSLRTGHRARQALQRNGFNLLGEHITPEPRINYRDPFELQIVRAYLR